MEVKINKDIRQYSESIFFGLSMRQFIFSILACLVAVGLYFILRPYFGIETLSWMCILGAAPFGVLRSGVLLFRFLLPPPLLPLFAISWLARFCSPFPCPLFRLLLRFLFLFLLLSNRVMLSPASKSM